METRVIGLERYSIQEIKSCVYDHVSFLKQSFVFEDLDFSINQINIFGSRIYGIPKNNSDLDIMLEYTGKAREDDLFNALNNDEHRLRIEDIEVDFFPKKIEN